MSSSSSTTSTPTILYADRVVVETSSTSSSSSSSSPSTKQFAPAADRNKEPIGQVLHEFLGGTETHTVHLLEIASGTGQHAVFFTGLLKNVLWYPTEFDPLAFPSIDSYREDNNNNNNVNTTNIRQRIAKPLILSVLSPPEMWPTPSTWPVDPTDTSSSSSSSSISVPSCFDAVLVVNLLHISPWECTSGLFAGIQQVLSQKRLREPSSVQSDDAAPVTSASSLISSSKATTTPSPPPLPLVFIYGPFLVDHKPTTDSNAAFDSKLKGMDPRFGLRDIQDVTHVAETLGGLKLVEARPMPSNNFMLIFTSNSKSASGE